MLHISIIVCCFELWSFTCLCLLQVLCSFFMDDVLEAYRVEGLIINNPSHCKKRFWVLHKLKCWNFTGAYYTPWSLYLHFSKGQNVFLMSLVFIQTPLSNPISIKLFKVGKRNTRAMCEIHSKSVTNLVIVNFEQISHIASVYPLFTVNK